MQQEYRPSHKGPVRDLAHLQAVVKRDMTQLQSCDPVIKQLAQEDMGVLEEKDPLVQGALQVYCSTVSAFDPGPNLRKLAFQAVLRNDVQTLKNMLDCGQVQWDTRNAGGQTLLEVAHERQKDACKELLASNLKEPKALVSSSQGKPEPAGVARGGSPKRTTVTA